MNWPKRWGNLGALNFVKRKEVDEIKIGSRQGDLRSTGRDGPIVRVW